MKKFVIDECNKILNNPEDYLLMDAEMTGVGNDDEIIELALVDLNGNEIYHELFYPEAPISIEAGYIHQIKEEDLFDSPRFAEAWPAIFEQIKGKTLLIYNARSDIQMMYQTLKKQKAKSPMIKNLCVQQLYEKFCGLKRSVKLEFACEQMGLIFEQNHRATDDCLMTLALIKAMAKSEL